MQAQLTPLPLARSSPRLRSTATLTVLVALGLAPRPVWADDAADERKLAARSALSQFAAANDEATQGYFARFADDVAGCRAAIKDGTAAGLRPSDTFDTVNGPVLWRAAAATCDTYARLQPMRAAVAAVEVGYQTVVTIRGVDGEGISGMTGDAYRSQVATAKQCVASVDQAIKDRAPTDVAFLPTGSNVRVTLAEVRAQCTDFIAFAAKAGAADDAAVAAAEGALRAKYARLGISGDRLRYLMDTDNRMYVMGKGCKALDLAGKKKAAVIFEMQEADTYWVVYKMTFKGDKLVKTTEQRFNKLTSSGWRCK